MALDNEFILSELIKKGSAALNQNLDDMGNVVVNTSIDSDGETFGYVERPRYNEDELVKAVDVVVDELITEQKPQGPAVVLKTVYDDLRELYNQALRDIKDLEIRVSDLEAENEGLRTRIEDLLRQVDLANLLKAGSDNERDAVQQALQQISMDLQTALVKGTKEGIERVSREAALQGALADKESFVKLQQQANETIKVANETIDTLQTNLTRVQADYALAISNFIASK